MKERERKREEAEQRNATYSTNGHNENRQHAVVFDTCLDSYPLLILQDRLLWIGPWESFPLICKKDIATIASKDGRDLQEWQWLPLSRNHRNDRAIIHNQGRRGATARASSRNLVIILQLTSFQSRWPLKRRKKTSGGEAVKDGSRLRRRRRGSGRGGNGGNESGTAKEEDGGKKKSRGLGADLDSTARERRKIVRQCCFMYVVCSSESLKIFEQLNKSLQTFQTQE